jgi:hypothetical protein
VESKSARGASGAVKEFAAFHATSRLEGEFTSYKRMDARNRERVIPED